MKHIESILPEYAADDMTRMLLGDATATAALTFLLHDWTGCDIPQTSDLPESEVEELVPLCVSILRRHWQTPLTCLGDGTTPMSLSDLMRQLIDGRVNGNEALGIPPANANLPTAVSALRQRDMSSGLTLTLTDGTDGSTDGSTTSPTTMPLPDGLSLAQLLCSSDVAGSVTELIDSNIGWVMSKAFSGFPNIKRLTILGKGIMALNWFTGMSSLEELVAPNISKYSHGSAGSDVATMPAGVSNLVNLKKLDLRGLGDAFVSGNGNQYAAVIAGCPVLKEVWLGKAKGLNNHESWGYTKFFIQYCSAIETISVEDMAERNCLVRSGQNENLVCLQIRGTQSNSCNLNWWSPTTALSERLDEFLSNFQLYIADRVADRTGTTALTLTLSAAVYEALQAQEGQTILATLTNKNWTVAQA